MKSSITVLIVGLTLALTSPAFAGPDGSQIMQMRHAAEVLHAEKLAQAKQERAGVAGSIGVPGKLGPGTRPTILRRDPTTHP